MASRIARVQAFAPRLLPASPSCNFKPIFRAASFATFALRPPTSVPLRRLSADAGQQPLQTRRQALLRAAARFDGDVGQLLVAFTEQNASKCLEAEIAELERLMQLPQSDLTALVARPGVNVGRPHLTWDNGMLLRFLSFARYCNGSEEFR